MQADVGAQRGRVFPRPIVAQLARHGAAGQSQLGQTALHLAARTGSVDVVKHVIQQGADLEKEDPGGWTAMHYAAAYGNADVVDHLLRCNANVRKDNRGRTPLHLAARKGSAATVLKLLDGAGADQVVIVNSVDAERKSPLQCAIESDSIETAKILLVAGAHMDGVALLRVATETDAQLPPLPRNQPSILSFLNHSHRAVTINEPLPHPMAQLFQQLQQRWSEAPFEEAWLEPHRRRFEITFVLSLNRMEQQTGIRVPTEMVWHILSMLQGRHFVSIMSLTNVADSDGG